MTVIDEEEWGRWQKKLLSEGVWINIVLKSSSCLSLKVLSCLCCPHQTKLNSHKNLCKAVNLDQIGFDLSANEISAPDRRFVIDSVLNRGVPWSCRIWSENNGLWVPKHDQLQMWQIASHDLGLSWPRTPCLAWIYRAKKPFCGGNRSNISNVIQVQRAMCSAC